jgi:hypothetical protein
LLYSETEDEVNFSKECIRVLLREYTRSWKLFTLFIGLALLIVAHFHYQISDWDVPICFIMAFLAYLTVSWSMYVVVERRWKMLPLMLFYTLFSIDVCYRLYGYFKYPQTLEQKRDANLFASLSIYCMCGLVWYYQGGIKQFIAYAKSLTRGKGGR